MTAPNFSRLVLSLGVAVFAGFPARAADEPQASISIEKLTLDAAIAEALERSPALRVVEAEIEAARGEALTARLKPPAELAISPGIRRLDDGGNSRREFLGSLELSRTFLFPGKRELLVSLAERNVELRRLALDGGRFQLTAAVRRSFYELLAAQNIVGLRREQLDSAQAFFDATNQRVASGYASDFEAVKSRGDVINARKLLAAAEGAITAAKVELNSLLGRDPSAAVEVSGTLDDTARRISPRDLLAAAFAHSPSLRAQAMEGEIAEMNVRKARLARKPDLTIGPSLEYGPSEQIIGVGVSIPLLERNYGRGEVLTATAGRRRASAESERLRREIAGTVAAASAQLETARRQLALYSPAYLAQLKGVVAQAERGYTQNVTSLLIYLDAKRTYFDTLADHHDAVAQVASSRAALEAAVGVPLESIPSSMNR